MKNKRTQSQIFGMTTSRKFHNTTILKAFTYSKVPFSDWPDSWKMISYKAYPRLKQVLLPKPSLPHRDLEVTLLERSSIRDFKRSPISKKYLSNLLYFSAGMKQYLTGHPSTKRYYPSAGARYPLEVYPLVFHVHGLTSGGYHYHVKTHSVERLFDLPTAQKVFQCVDQDWMTNASIILIITAIFDRTEEKYGSRGYRHILTEYGHVAQNVYLVAAALGLGCCSVGGFIDEQINRLLDLDVEDEGIVGMIAIGNSSVKRLA